MFLLQESENSNYGCCNGVSAVILSKERLGSVEAESVGAVQHK